MHHINIEGKDGGVVYCEMQSVENTGESLVHNTLMQEMYPGDCGYKSVTGGLMKNLRESTTIEKVRLTKANLKLRFLYFLIFAN